STPSVHSRHIHVYTSRRSSDRQLNAGSSAIPISPNIIGCITRPGTTAQFLAGCLATGGMAPSGPTAPTGPGFGTGHGVQDHYSQDRKSTRLNSSHVKTAYAVFC